MKRSRFCFTWSQHFSNTQQWSLLPSYSLIYRIYSDLSPNHSTRSNRKSHVYRSVFIGADHCLQGEYTNNVGLLSSIDGRRFASREESVRLDLQHYKFLTKNTLDVKQQILIRICITLTAYSLILIEEMSNTGATTAPQPN